MSVLSGRGSLITARKKKKKAPLMAEESSSPRYPFIISG